MAARSRQRGTALVENALTMVVFLMMVMAIIEFSLLMYVWTRGVEAAREVSRLAIVSTPAANLGNLDCEGGTVTELTANCSGNAQCDSLVARAVAFLPQVEADNVTITYRCSGAGFDGRPESMLIPEVVVEITGLNYDLIIPSLIGFPRTWDLPSMTSTRTGEDMETVVAP